MPSSLLPQAVDLLQLYQGQVALGKITFYEDQVRVVAEVRSPTVYPLHLLLYEIHRIYFSLENYTRNSWTMRPLL